MRLMINVDHFLLMFTENQVITIFDSLNVIKCEKETNKLIKW